VLGLQVLSNLRFLVFITEFDSRPLQWLVDVLPHCSKLELLELLIDVEACDDILWSEDNLWGQLDLILSTHLSVAPRVHVLIVTPRLQIPYFVVAQVETSDRLAALLSLRMPLLHSNKTLSITTAGDRLTAGNLLANL
jgi:hypothetical protein